MTLVPEGDRDEVSVRRASTFQGTTKPGVLIFQEQYSDRITVKELRTQMERDACLVVESLTGNLPHAVLSRVTAKLLSHLSVNITTAIEPL